MRRAFTLMEINLAIMVMASGLLSTVALFSLGYSESAQSNEDTSTAAYSEEIVERLVLALSDTNLEWNKFNSIADSPSTCWSAYLNESTGEVKSGSAGTAAGVFASTMAKLSTSKVPASMPSLPEIFQSGNGGGMGLVITHEQNSPIVGIGFRASRKERKLMSAPLYYTEVYFQGTK